MISCGEEGFYSRSTLDALALRLGMDSIKTSSVQGALRSLQSSGLIFKSSVDGRYIIESWQAMYNDLIAFKEREGHCNVPNKYPENKQLGAWCGTQRQAKKKRQLSHEKIKALEGVGFVWDLSGPSWEEMYNHLIAFKESEGHCNVPYNYPENKQLYTWCGTQRQAMKKGQLSNEKIKALEGVGFIWEPRKKTKKNLEAVC